MEQINRIAEDFLRGARDDYVGLWEIPAVIRRDTGLSDNVEVKARTLDIVRILLGRGLIAGDFDYANSKLYPWSEPATDATISRIDKAWDAAKGDPNLAEPICWFDLRNRQPTL